MSSSRIIRSGMASAHTVRSFSFESMSVQSPWAPLAPAESSDAGGFVPLALGVSLPAALPAEGADPSPAPGELIIPPEGMLMLSEDELQTKVDEVYHNGMEEGRRQAERGLANVFKSLRDAVAAVTGLHARVLKESEEDLLQLAMMIARKIVQQEITQSREVLASVVAAAVGGCAARDRVVIRLNPDDYATVSANRQRYLGGLGDEGQISLAPDETIMGGGCLVESATGTVDARIDSQLDEIYRILLEERSTPVEMLALPLPPTEKEAALDLALVPDEAIPPFKGPGTWVKAPEEKPHAEA